MSVRRPWAVRSWAITVACMILAISAAFLCLAGAARAATATPVIIDTDMFSSADDVGAVATAFALEHDGLASVKAITLNTRTINGQRPVATDTYKCVQALEYYYGSGATIGVQGGTLGSPTPNTPDFVGPCGKLDPGSVPSSPLTALSVDESVLNAAADHSVVIICTGYEGNIAALLSSDAALIQQKVKMLVIMGGGYPSWTPPPPGENNFYGDPSDAAYVATNWPSKTGNVPIVYDGQEIGDAVNNGQTITGSQPVYSPLRVAYEAFVGPNNYYGSYDLTAAYFGIEASQQTPSDLSAGGLFTPVAGTNAVDSTTGMNTFTASAGGPEDYISFASASSPQTVSTNLESLLDYTPAQPSGVTTPTNSVAPAITGTAQVGQPLTASTGTWTGNPTLYIYQWLACGSSGCSPIPKANQSTYTPDATNLGETLEVQVTALVPGAGAGPVTSAATAAVISPTTPVPTITAAPTISGTPQTGQTLTESHGSWTGAPTSYTYQWQLCDSAGAACSSIPLATLQSYTPIASDVGHTIRVQETAINGGGASVPSSSAATAVVTTPAGTAVPANISAPAIYGNAVEGQTLSESHGSWTGSPTGYTYQWEVCDWMGNNCSPISGATSQSYTLTGADVGNTIRVLETATNAGGSSAPVASSATGLVAGQSSGNNPPPPPGGSRNVTAKVIHTALMQALVPRGRGAGIRMLQRTHSYLFAFTAPVAGHLVVSWFYTPRHGRKVLIGRARVLLHHAGRARIRLVLTKKGRIMLQHSRTLRLTATGSFTPLHERTTSASRKLTLKR